MKQEKQYGFVFCDRAGTKIQGTDYVIPVHTKNSNSEAMNDISSFMHCSIAEAVTYAKKCNENDLNCLTSETDITLYTYETDNNGMNGKAKHVRTFNNPDDFRKYVDTISSEEEK